MKLLPLVGCAEQMDQDRNASVAPVGKSNALPDHTFLVDYCTSGPDAHLFFCITARGVSMLTISDFDGYFAQPDLGMAGLASSSTESEDDQEGHEDDEDWSEDPDESDPDLLASDEAGATWWNWQRAQ